MGGVIMVLGPVLICISIVTNNVERLFICLFAVVYHFWCIVCSHLWSSLRLGGFLIKFWELKYVRNASPFSGIWFANIYLPSVDYKFCGAKVIHFDDIQFISFLKMDCAFGVVSQKSLPHPMSQRFSLRKFLFLHFITEVGTLFL